MAVTQKLYQLIAGSVNLLPIRAVAFNLVGETAGLYFYQIEKESSYNIRAVQRNHSSGGLITVGYKLEAIFYIMNNPFNHYNFDLPKTLESYRNQTVTTKILLGNVGRTDTEWVNPPSTNEWFTDPIEAKTRTKVINYTDKMIVDFGPNTIFNYEFESVEYRPRLIIKVNGVLKSPTAVIPSTDPN